MRIGIVACEALRSEVESIVGDDPDVVHREYLEFGLHLHPEDLKRTILERLGLLSGKVDMVFLGYGYCQKLQGLPGSVDIPLVMLECEDCIAALLTKERYDREKHKEGITWFYPTGWAGKGAEGLVDLFNLGSVRELGYPPEYFLDLMFEGFTRCLYVDTGTDRTGQSETNSEVLAFMLGLKHERTEGSLLILREAWSRAKSAGRESLAGPQPELGDSEATRDGERPGEGGVK